MADSNFFKRSEPFRLGKLAEITESQLADKSMADKEVVDVCALDSAENNHIGFLDNKKYLESFKKTKAGACFVNETLSKEAPEGTVCLISKNPYKSYALAAQAFYPDEVSSKENISANALIDKTAKLGSNCTIQSGVVIGANVKIGANCTIQSNTVIGDGVSIGDNCYIAPQVYISHAIIGSNVKLHAGVKIGNAGFGFAIDATGFTSIPQLGRVIIEDYVDIGANSTIDRGAGPDTVIGQGTRIDNLVQIAHNVKIGKNCILVSQSGVAGSSVIGNGVVIGGQAAISGHLKIGSGARIAGKSGVMRDIPDGNIDYMGTPAVPIKQHMRQVAMITKMASNKKKGNNNE